MDKKLFYILAVIILTGILAGIYITNVSEAPEEETGFCMMDAKLCPDGSYVGRIPPDCGFATCPVPAERLGACDADGKLCPDGITVVGRIPPECEFEICPSDR